jgi:ADP-heptose:LPS heptosyltransferase
MPLLPDVRRVVVLPAAGIGDLMFALPALHALQAAYPGALISLLGAPWHRAFLSGRPGPVGEVLVVPPGAGPRMGPAAGSASPEGRAGVKDDQSPEDFFAAMQARAFDLALQMHGGGHQSNPFVARLGARVTVGLRAPGAVRLDLQVPYVYYQPEVFRLLEVARLVGADPVDIEPRLALTPADRLEADSVLPADEQPLALLHPGAGDPRRRWPTGGFAAVGDALRAAGAKVAVVGAECDARLGQEVAGAMKGRAANLVGRLSLGGLTGLLGRCRVLVSNDSGPLHLAAAVGTATVGIFWCGNLINAGPPYRTRHRPLLSWRLACPVCGVDCTLSRCEHDASFVADVPAGEVAAAAVDLLLAEEDGERAVREPSAAPPRSRESLPGRPG